jgi:hypothetical protein
MNGKFMIYADVRDLSNVHRAHGARLFGLVDYAAASLHSAVNQQGAMQQRPLGGRADDRVDRIR